MVGSNLRENVMYSILVGGSYRGLMVMLLMHARSNYITFVLPGDRLSLLVIFMLR